MLNFLCRQKSCFYFTSVLSELLCRGGAWLSCCLELLPLTHLQHLITSWNTPGLLSTCCPIDSTLGRGIWLLCVFYLLSSTSFATLPPSSLPPAFSLHCGSSVSHSSEPQQTPLWACYTCWATCLSLSCLPLPATRQIQTHPFNPPPCLGVCFWVQRTTSHKFLQRRCNFRFFYNHRSFFWGCAASLSRAS